MLRHGRTENVGNVFRTMICIRVNFSVHWLVGTVSADYVDTDGNSEAEVRL